MNPVTSGTLRSNMMSNKGPMELLHQIKGKINVILK